MTEKSALAGEGGGMHAHPLSACYHHVQYRLIQRFARTDPRKYFFAVTAVDPWNKLPDDLRLATSKEQLQAKMKRV
jgi:hypothetical protein